MRTSRCRRIPGTSLAGACLSLLLGSVAEAQERLILTGATLFAGTRADTVAGARIILVDGRFTCVSAADGCPAEPGDATLDLSGLWITPGLIDTHAHVNIGATPERARNQQARRFMLGITTVRDGGSLQLDALLEERARARSEDHPYPRIVVAERPTAPYDEHYGVRRGAPLVQRLAELGVDAIKVKDHVGDDSLFVEEIREARRLGLPVYGHTWHGPPARSLTHLGMDAGLDGLSHLEAIPLVAQPPEVDLTTEPHEEDPSFVPWRKGLWVSADDTALETFAEQLVERGIWLEPLLVTEYYWGLPLRPSPAVHFLRDVPPSLRDLLMGRDLLTERVGPAFPEPYARMTEFVRDFAERGGLVVAGTDGVSIGLDLHAEIRLLREGGLSAEESLRAATANAAVVLRRDDLGTIEPGKTADAVVFSANPLADPLNTLRIRHVIKGGRVYDAEGLRAPFLARYEARVREAWIRRGIRLARLALPAGLLLAVVLVAARRAYGRRSAAA